MTDAGSSTPTRNGQSEPTRSGRSTPTRSGRRPGNPDTRQAILQAARTTFAELGFAGASIRKIAGAAGVDAALVHHYFGSKDKLFLATVDVPFDVPAMIAGLAAQGPDDLGRRLIGTILRVWESPAGAGLAVALRSALADPQRARMVREFVPVRLVGTMMQALGVPAEEVERRTGLVMSQLLGVVTGRYLLMMEPLASLPAEKLIDNVGATLQRYLTGPLADDAG